jgi:hypothetical protein
MTASLKHDPLTATEGVEEPLRVGFKLSLVVEIDQKLPLIENKADIVFLCIVRYKPVNQT